MRLLVGLVATVTVGLLSLLSFENVAKAQTPVATSISLSPGSATKEVFTLHSITATVKDQFMDPMGGVTVSWSGGPAGTCVTSSVVGPNLGTCTKQYGGPVFQPASDQIVQACFNPGTGNVCTTATVTWQLPTSTLGHAHGGGIVVPPGPASELEVVFGFNTKSTTGKIKGKCTIDDEINLVAVKCETATTYVQAGVHSFFYGEAYVNGDYVKYRMDVDDGGNTTGAIDIFNFVTEGGYAISGEVSKSGKGGKIHVQ